ncbi:hypothetical protein EV05_1392 [Prochlorococcus sp. MIT 0601]|nr:hypothetical protein EV05_1392 [Prochlorococcus sp. MIT 0601]
MRARFLCVKNLNLGLSQKLSTKKNGINDQIQEIRMGRLVRNR